MTDDLDRTLKWVNEVRAEFDLGPALSALPKGVRTDPSECPVARGIGAGGTMRVAVDPVMTWIEACGVHVSSPECVAEFIHEFDQGKYPELIA